MNRFVRRWVGLFLRGRHAGESALAGSDPVLANWPDTLALRSTAFAHLGAMPLRQAGEGVGANLSPELHWDALPPAASHWVLIVEDPEVPLRHAFVHALAAGPAMVRRLDEGALRPARVPSGVTLGLNGFGEAGYAGARPLPGHGTHRYVFQLFALTRAPEGASTREGLMAALRQSAIARGRLDGLFARDWRARPAPPIWQGAA